MKKSHLKELIKASKKHPVKEADSPDMGLLSNLETKLKTHDWYYMMSDDQRKYTRGIDQQREIRDILLKLDNSKEAKELYNKYAPTHEDGPDMKVSEEVSEDYDALEESSMMNKPSADIEEDGYEDGEKAVEMFRFKELQNRPDLLSYTRGFIQGIRDNGSYFVSETNYKKGMNEKDMGESNKKIHEQVKKALLKKLLKK